MSGFLRPLPLFAKKGKKEKEEGEEENRRGGTIADLRFPGPLQAQVPFYLNELLPIKLSHEKLGILSSIYLINHLSIMIPRVRLMSKPIAGT